MSNVPMLAEKHSSITGILEKIETREKFLQEHYLLRSELSQHMIYQTNLVVFRLEGKSRKISLGIWANENSNETDY